MKHRLLVFSVVALCLSGCSFAISSSASSPSRSSAPTSSSSTESSTSESSDEDPSDESSAESSEESSSEASSDSSAQSSSGASSGASSSASSSSTGPASPITPEFQKLFAPESRIEMRLDFPKASLQAISDYQSTRNGQLNDAYFPANLTVDMGDGKPLNFPEVGVRMKGNTSRGPIVNGYSLTPRHFKVSLKATFDGEEYDTYDALKPFKKTWDDAAARKERKNRNLFGLEKFDLKYVPRNNDWAYDGNINECSAREIYCYDAFRKAGVMAPYANIVVLKVDNGSSSYNSLYEIIESIDKEFLKKRLSKDEAKGDLYKCVYNAMGRADLTRDGAVEKDVVDGQTVGTRIAGGKIGVENNYDLYQPVYQLKTNDDLGEGANFSSMTNYINANWNLRYGHPGSTTISDILDVDSFLSFSAVSHLLGNFDDQFYNWNNYYIYFLPSNGKAYYIPYDWDWSLGLGGYDLVYQSPIAEGTLGEGGPSNVYYNTYLTPGSIQNNYLAKIDSLKTKILDSNAFYDLIQRLGIESYNNEMDQVPTYMENKLLSLETN